MTTTLQEAVLLPHSVASPAPATRALIAGDSITQSEAGRHSWRFDLWEALKAVGSFNFVGPRNDQYLSDNGIDNEYTTSGYANPDFDRNHAARWGMALGFKDWNFSNLVAQYRPDVAVIALGTNDVIFFPNDMWREFRMENLIAELRDANPNIKIIFVQVYREHATVPDARSNWNASLGIVAARKTTAQSPVVVATTSNVTVNDTYDGTHPNRSGEVKIAEAVRQALVKVGVGTLSAPIPLPNPDPVSGVHVSRISNGNRVSWSRPGPQARAEMWRRKRIKVLGVWKPWGEWVKIWNSPIPASIGDDYFAPVTRPTKFQYRVRIVEGTKYSAWTHSEVVLRQP